MKEYRIDEEDIEELKDFFDFLFSFTKDLMSFAMYAQKTVVSLGKAINSLARHADKSASKKEILVIMENVRDILDNFLRVQQDLSDRMGEAEEFLEPEYSKVYSDINIPRLSKMLFENLKVKTPKKKNRKHNKGYNNDYYTIKSFPDKDDDEDKVN